MKPNDIERLINEKIERTTGISVVKKVLRFTPEEIGGILKSYGFEPERHVCDHFEYGKWLHLEKNFCFTCNMAGISWSLKITEEGTLARVGVFYGLKIRPMSDDALNILHGIKEDIFSLVTNNNGRGKFEVLFEHKMK